MFNQMNQKRIRQWMLFLIISMIGLCITPTLAGETNGGDTPQAVFKAAQAAGAAKDFNTLVKLTAPSEHAMLAFGSDMGVSMFVEFYEGEEADELKKKYKDIQKKFGINGEDEDDSEPLQITQDTPQDVIDEHMRKRAQKLYGHVDAAKYVPAIMALVVDMPEMAEQTFVPQEELVDLKINGDKASGNVGGQSIAFVQEGDRWYLTADIMN